MRADRPDLQDGWRDALALLHAWIDPDEERQAETLYYVLKIYPRSVDEFVFPLLFIAYVAALADVPLERTIAVLSRLAATV